MPATPEIENQAGLGRVTCGWKLPHLALADVRRFWRDVHSPAIARRAGVHEYRHNQFGAVRADAFAGLCNAIGLAMNSGFGRYQSAGFMALPYVMGMVARAGLTASRLAGLGMDAPRLAVEGDKGMFSAYSDEPREKFEAVLGSLGETWRILGNTYKTVPTETITHGPIECVMAVLKRAGGRTVERMRFGVEAIVVKIANERASAGARRAAGWKRGSTCVDRPISARRGAGRGGDALTAGRVMRA